LQLLHAVELEVVLEDLLAADYAPFVLALNISHDDAGASDLHHPRLLGLGVLYFEKLCHLGCSEDIDVLSDACLFLKFTFHIVDEVFNVFNVLIDKLVLPDAHPVGLSTLHHLRSHRDIKTQD
jgi:hypothetical protein